MSRPMVSVRNTSKWNETDNPNTQFVLATALTGIGTAAVTDANAPIFCDATQVALIDEIAFSCITADGTTDTIINLQVNGRTEGVHGATSTATARTLPFHFPGDAGLSRTDRYVIRPRGRMVVHPSSTLWVNAGTASVANCHIRYRKKNLTAAIRDGDISPNGSLPQVASTNSVTSGGLTAATSKLIAFAGSSMASGTADSGTNATVVDAERTEATDIFANKRIRFIAGANAGVIRVITSFNPGTDTITFAPVVGTPVGAGDTYEILDNDEAIEILGMYLTGHNNIAGTTDDIRLGYWNGGGTNFTTDGKMIFRGFTRGLNSRYGLRLLLDNVDRCIQGALGSDLWVQASTNLAGATPRADYNIVYRKVKVSTVSNTSGATNHIPVSRGKWWCLTETDPGVAEFLPFFDPASISGIGSATARLKGYAHSAVCTQNATPATVAIGFSPGLAATLDPELVNGLTAAGVSSNTWGRDGIAQDTPLADIPGFVAVDLGNVISSRCSLAFGTFGTSVVSRTVAGTIA